jgi:hypothetical protein
MGNETATWKPVEAGVVQGSVLSQTLFLLFISDLNVHVGEAAGLIKFADDLLTFSVFKELANDRIQLAASGVAMVGRQQNATEFAQNPRHDHQPSRSRTDHPNPPEWEPNTKSQHVQISRTLAK